MSELRMLICWEQHGGQCGCSDVTMGEAWWGKGAGTFVLHSAEGDGRFCLLSC